MLLYCKMNCLHYELSCVDETDKAYILNSKQLIKPSSRSEYLFPVYRIAERTAKEFNVHMMTSKEDA